MDGWGNTTYASTAAAVAFDDSFKRRLGRGGDGERAAMAAARVYDLSFCGLGQFAFVDGRLVGLSSRNAVVSAGVH